MTDSGHLVGGVIGLGIGMVVADSLLNDHKRSRLKRRLRKGSRRTTNWVERETNF